MRKVEEEALAMQRRRRHSGQSSTTTLEKTESGLTSVPNQRIMIKTHLPHPPAWNLTETNSVRPSTRRVMAEIDLLETKRLLHILDAVQLLPGEQLDLHILALDTTTIGAHKCLDRLSMLASHMTIGSGL